MFITFQCQSDGKVHKVHSIMRVQHLFFSASTYNCIQGISVKYIVTNVVTLYLQDIISYTYGSGIMNTCSREYEVEKSNNLEGIIITSNLCDTLFD